MFTARKYNPVTKKVELWRYEWQKKDGRSKKVFMEKVEDDDGVGYARADELKPGNAVCWSFEGTMGNIAVESGSVLGCFEAETGSDAILPCDILKAGKFRHGAPRWYCRTHMVYWGTNADRVAQKERGADEGIICSNSRLKFSYLKNPLVLDLNDYSEVGIWCSLPQAISSQDIKSRHPMIHVHARSDVSGIKVIDEDFDAIVCKKPSDLFESDSITQIQITPPAVLSFLTASVSKNRETLDCVSCNKCHFPHLDLGKFAKEPHSKHFCANCGNDSTWTKPGIVSNPLKTLHDYYCKSDYFKDPGNKIDIDYYAKGDFDFDVWASTPAIVWKGKRAQERGIHVHIRKDEKIEVDDTYSEVIYKGELLDRDELLTKMLNNCLDNF